MKRLITLVFAVFSVCLLWAGTPAQDMVDKYKEQKGAKYYSAKGALMKMARPLMKSYSMAPLAHKVTEMYVLRMDKVRPETKSKFLYDLKKTLGHYIYAGKSDSPNGVVDAYVHIASTDVADELVVYNPEICTLYSLIGSFTKEELQKVQKPVVE
jgi:hypothetical protein